MALTGECHASLVLPEGHAHRPRHLCLTGIIQGLVILHQALEHLRMPMCLTLHAIISQLKTGPD